RECRGLGIANVVSGFFGGTCGCAMIAQAIVNVNSGGRGRLSNFTSGTFLMVLIFLLNDFMVQIPLAALVAVMITASIATFDWDSLRNLTKMPRTDALVIVVVVAVVTVTSNLAYGVVIGLVMTAIFFAMKMSKIKVEKAMHGNTVTYNVIGQVFFASTEPMMDAFDFKGDAEFVILDFTNATLLDESAATALKKSVSKFEGYGKQVEVRGLDASSVALVSTLYGPKKQSI
ncbi:MAG: SulP family inorganic anion transporter, partial [Peptococcaceae bacterium]|nr:SulP family inorganic anion transporter [Peptococcaceae bacterium]